MLIEIKEVKWCHNKAVGNFVVTGQQSALITISLKKNTTIAEYTTTVFHELMHLWITILRAKGFRCSGIKEHKFVYAAEKHVLRMAKKHLRDKRRRP